MMCWVEFCGCHTFPGCSLSPDAYRKILFHSNNTDVTIGRAREKPNQTCGIRFRWMTERNKDYVLRYFKTGLILSSLMLKHRLNPV